MTLVEYGTDLNHGNYSATNSLLVTNHVMTVSGLTPGRTYYFQIDANAGGALCTYQAYFAASNFVHLALLFDVTHVWKFATNDLAAIPWQGPPHDDAHRTGRGRRPSACVFPPAPPRRGLSPHT